MLARVASHLYWLSRYVERAENMARILDVGQSLALLDARAGDDSAAAEPLVITENVAAFEATKRPTNSETVARFLAWDPGLASSIASCLEASRENARAVRGSITSEMWECINDTWMQLHARRRAGQEPINSEFFDWVKERSHLFRGITSATLRRGQPYHFIRLATFIERGDNTARILSVKHARGAQADGEVESDYYRLSSVLRSVSALEAYRDTYRDAIGPRRVAQLLIFDERLPRSLRFCSDQIATQLTRLPQEAGRAARRIAATVRAGLAYGDVDDIEGVRGEGLYLFLDQFLKDNRRLAEAVQGEYMEMQ